MSYDFAAGRVVYMGGYNDGGNMVSDTYVFDLKNNSWKRSMSTGPTQRVLAAMAYDQAAGQALLFGGYTGSLRDGETWDYAAADDKWTKLAPTQSPEGRNSHGMASDPVNAVTVLFGGYTQSGKNSDETWVRRRTPPPPVAPKITTTSPVHGAIGIPAASEVVVEFDQAMDSVPTVAAFSISPSVAGGNTAVVGTRLTFTHSTLFLNNTLYTANISSGAKSTSGINMVGAYSFSFRTYDPPPPVAPKVVSTSPADGEIDVLLGADVTIQFSLDMDPTSTASAFWITPALAGTAFVSGPTLSWQHPTNFQYGSSYQVLVNGSARSSAGVPLGTAASFIFTTEILRIPPKVTSTSPLAGSVDVPLDALVIVTFDREMDAASTVAAFSIDPPVANWTLEVGGWALAWSHSPQFEPGRIYSVTVKGTAMSNLGVPMGPDYEFQFATASTPPPPPPPTPKAIIQPDEGATEVPLDTRLVITFSEKMERVTAEAALEISPTLALGLSWDADAKVLTGTPNDGFESGMTYRVTIARSAKSAAGAFLEQTVSSTFTTVTLVPPPPPSSDVGAFLGNNLILLLLVLAAIVAVVAGIVLARRRKPATAMPSPFGGSTVSVKEARPAGPPPIVRATPPRPPDIERSEETPEESRSSAVRKATARRRHGR